MSKALMAVLLLAAFLVAGSMDYADEMQTEQHTCAMVADGHWPAAVAPYCNDEE